MERYFKILPQSRYAVVNYQGCGRLCFFHYFGNLKKPKDLENKTSPLALRLKYVIDIFFFFETRSYVVQAGITLNLVSPA